MAPEADRWHSFVVRVLLVSVSLGLSFVGSVACGGTVEDKTGVSGAGGRGENTGGAGKAGASFGGTSFGGASFGGSIQLGGSSGTFGTGGTLFPGTGGASPEGGAGGVRVPEKHRPYENPGCAVDAKPAPPPPPLPDGGAPSPYCFSDADCTQNPHGRCEMHEGYGGCIYDLCVTNADCLPDEVCDCASTPFTASRCVIGGCRSDAACGANGFCSPTFGFCGPFGGVAAYQCHTAADECIDDTDCQATNPSGYCAYDSTVGHWTCNTAICVG